MSARSCLLICSVVICAVAIQFVACQSPEQGNSKLKTAGLEKIQLRAWAHSGQVGERTAIEQQVKRFNKAQKEFNIELEFIPEGAYHAQVQAAALAGDLPDIFEFDGPYVHNYVWRGKLLALDSLFSRDVLKNIIPSIRKQGNYNNRLYSVATFDSGLGIYARASALSAKGIRIPKGPEDAWSVDEFSGVLSSLAKDDPDGMVLDLKLNYQGEWFTYAFSPFIQSAGADLIDRDSSMKARGFLDSPLAISAMERVQRWIVGKKYVDPNIDDRAFVEGRVALSLAGHWEYARYSKAFARDLIVLPLPDFGHGSQSAQGSWTWGISSTCIYPKLAVKFLEFLLQDRQVLEMTESNGAVPATYSAISKSKLYAKGAPLRLFSKQLIEGFTVARPQTPAYPVITSVFQEAFNDIRSSVDVSAVLQKAAREIDQDLVDNRGYTSRE